MQTLQHPWLHLHKPHLFGKLDQTPYQKCKRSVQPDPVVDPCTRLSGYRRTPMLLHPSQSAPFCLMAAPSL
uniref:Uncharacterized protein n=1 Tax=Arundo donax TaxID=35708 RepID=A0A0A9G7Y3_ARUDO